MKCEFYFLNGLRTTASGNGFVAQFITLFLLQEFPQCGKGLDVQESVSGKTHVARCSPVCALIKRIPENGRCVDDCAREKLATRVW